MRADSDAEPSCDEQSQEVACVGVRVLHVARVAFMMHRSMLLAYLIAMDPVGPYIGQCLVLSA